MTAELIIRDAVDEDVSSIVELLKRSLGETLLPKSEPIWRYKHHLNPFGNSKVLVAEIEEPNGKLKLVGVRAFMRWQWQRLERIAQGFRAVDTATDPDYQGRGIFKQLTLRCLKELEDESDAFVFNTPNVQSRPGYLKMGWQDVARIRVTMFPRFPRLLTAKNLHSSSDQAKTGEFGPAIFSELESLVENVNEQQLTEDRWFTPKSLRYLTWRYLENPLQDYKIGFGNGWLVATYTKPRRWFRELRIAELLISSKCSNAAKDAWRYVSEQASLNRCHVITCAPGRFKGYSRNWGPMLTVRDISLDVESSQLTNLTAWAYQLGELELF